jgi:hypothetical protein
VRRAAAWVAWAEWICNSAAAQAVDDMGPADLSDRRGLFFWCGGDGRPPRMRRS